MKLSNTTPTASSNPKHPDGSPLHIRFSMPSSSLARLTLPQPACSAEFCPLPDTPSLLAVGTYLLADQATQSKSGCIHFFDVEGAACSKLEQPDGAENARYPGHIDEIGAYDMTAVFDCKWRPLAGPGGSLLLGVAGADSNLTILDVNPLRSDGHQCQLELAGVKTLCAAPVGEKIMALSLEWGRPESSDSDSVAVSSSDGCASIFKLREAALVLEHHWQAHDLEAWVVTKDRFQPAVHFTGADDCKLKVWDSRQGFDSPVHSNRRSHEMGVCCLQGHPQREHILCSGSYDEKVRLWDMRNLSKPTMVAEHATGGGVWRLKWHSEDSCLLLTASMHAGFFVLRIGDDFSSVSTVDAYKAQESLAYGVDWRQRGLLSGAKDVVATCSFYDKQLHTWSPEAEAT